MQGSVAQSLPSELPTLQFLPYNQAGRSFIDISEVPRTRSICSTSVCASLLLLVELHFNTTAAVSLKRKVSEPVQFVL